MRLKHLLNRALAWGYLKASPAARVAKVKESGGRTRYLTAEERQMLLDGASPVVRRLIVAALQSTRPRVKHSVRPKVPMSGIRRRHGPTWPVRTGFARFAGRTIPRAAFFAAGA